MLPEEQNEIMPEVVDYTTLIIDSTNALLNRLEIIIIILLFILGLCVFNTIRKVM